VVVYSWCCVGVPWFVGTELRDTTFARNGRRGRLHPRGSSCDATTRWPAVARVVNSPCPVH